MIAELGTAVIGPPGLPLDDRDQLTVPWACTACGSRQGFRRRGAASKPRKIATARGIVVFRSQAVQCRACLRRFTSARSIRWDVLAIGLVTRTRPGSPRAG